MNTTKNGVQLVGGDWAAKKDESESNDGSAEGDGKNKRKKCWLEVCRVRVYAHSVVFEHMRTTSLNPMPG